MEKFVKFYVDKYYFEKDYETFRKKCREVPDYYLELTKITKSLCSSQSCCNFSDDPCITIIMKFNGYEKNDFCIEYTTLLEISKAADLFYIQHEFSVENKDPERIEPVLDGYSGKPYALCQYNAEQQIRKFLISNGLNELVYDDMNEVVEGIDLSEIGMEESLLGPQMTIENALFRDLWVPLKIMFL